MTWRRFRLVLRKSLAPAALVIGGICAGATLHAMRPAPLALVVPQGPIEDFAWRALPEFGGAEAIIYRSPDRRRVAAAFRESGDFTFTYPFDEFLVVTAGSGLFGVRGGPRFTLRKGDVAYFRQGMTVHMTLSRDFADVTMLVSDRAVRWR